MSWSQLQEWPLQDVLALLSPPAAAGLLDDLLDAPAPHPPHTPHTGLAPHTNSHAHTVTFFVYPIEYFIATLYHEDTKIFI